MIEEQGSFAVGGSVTTAPGTFDPIRQGAFNPAGADPAGQTLHGDHAYVFYQVPVDARKLPLVFWHGHGQSAKTWETTPDGREGFQTIFLRRRFPVYLIDQPRRGRAARGTQPIAITAAPDEQLWFGIFRLGAWPNFYPGVQFSRDPEALDQFFRQMVPNTGPYDVRVNTEAVSALFSKIGPGVLVTHSQSGGLGWRTAIKNRNVRAVVSYEPGFDFPFPEGGAAGYDPRRQSAERDNRVSVGVHAAHENTHRYLLRRQHPRETERESGTGAMAHFSRYGEEVAGCREPPWRRCQPRASAGDRSPRQHSLPDVGYEQCSNCGSAVEVSVREEAGLKKGGNRQRSNMQGGLFVGGASVHAAFLKPYDNWNTVIDAGACRGSRVAEL